jgi:hypothetical protein
MNIFFKLAVICGCIAMGALVIYMIMAAMSLTDMKEPSKTEIYQDEVVDVDTDRIILSNGDVIFARGMNLFTWKIGQTYEITVETYSNRFGYIAPKVVTEVKET